MEAIWRCFQLPGVDPNLEILGLPTSVRNVAGAKAAIDAVQELRVSGKGQIKIVQADVGEITLAELERQASEQPSA